MHRDKKSEINQCIENIKNTGSSDAIVRLHSLIGSSIRYIALKYFKDQQDAQELVQDFWADIYETAKGYKYLSNGFSYLCKVMTNKTINKYRKLNKLKVVSLEYFAYQNYETTAYIDDAVYSRQIVYQAMEALSDKEKYVIQELFFLGKKMREIANEMGVSKAYISKLKRHAIQVMYEIITVEEINKI